MKNILVVITTAFVPTGGLTTVMMNYYRMMNKEEVKIDFASTNNPPQVLLDEIHASGSESVSYTHLTLPTICSV